jgi:hypothetical protein
LREKVTNIVVSLHYIPSKEQIVDIFTKPLAKAQFEYLRQKLGMTPLSVSVSWKPAHEIYIKKVQTKLIKKEREIQYGRMRKYIHTTPMS